MTVKKASDKVTRDVTAVENLVKKRLWSFYQKEIAPFAKDMPMQTFRRLHEDKVKAIIRKAIQDSYQTGMNIVSDQINEKFEFDVFISSNDLKNIQRLTEKYNERFWGTVDRLVQRETETKVVQNAIIEKPSFDAEAAIDGFSSDLAFGTYNDSVLEKFKESLDLLHFQPVFRIVGNVPAIVRDVQAISNIVQDQPFFPLSTELPPEFPTEQFNLDLLSLGGQIIFLTKEDEKVDDKICAPLNRTQYDVSDPAIPIPIQDTHPNCRCRLVPLLIGQSPDEFVVPSMESEL